MGRGEPLLVIFFAFSKITVYFLSMRIGDTDSHIDTSLNI